eukprot:5790009-Amphidinium_carterae.1
MVDGHTIAAEFIGQSLVSMPRRGTGASVPMHEIQRHFCLGARGGLQCYFRCPTLCKRGKGEWKGPRDGDKAARIHCTEMSAIRACCLQSGQKNG